MSCKILVLISGNGSNLQAIIDALAPQKSAAQICAVISNAPQAYGLKRAQQANIPTVVVDHQAYASRAEFDQALLSAAQLFNADLIVLAGFMRILSNAFVAAFSGRLINIHPSLLPKYPGLHTHQKVLAAGDAEHGCSVHFVTSELDGGPLIAQSRLSVQPGEDAATLAARVHQLEHILYPQVIAWYAQGRLRLNAQAKAELDGKALQF